MFRSIFLPALIASVIVGPIIYQKSQTYQGFANNNGSPVAIAPPNRQNSSIYGGSVAPQSIYHTLPTQSGGQSPTAAPIGSVAAQRGLSVLPASSQTTRPPTLPQPPNQAVPPYQPVPPYPAVAPYQANAFNQASSISGNQPFMLPASIGQPPMSSVAGLTPDYGKIETKIYRGDANGPDLTSAPLGFIPITDFREVFNFNLTQQWIKNRFERISTTPADAGLHGLRTALVTGTNSWDLHGSQTWFFDANHRVQRITFRGWVGDPSRLLQLATEHFGLKPQPTHWAGLYVANFRGKTTGGLVMKDPNVIDRRNKVERTAVLMEINQPSGGFEISNEFRGLINSAKEGK